ncbi:DNA-binding protein, histone-like, putative [Xylanibacter ruminicola]|uniref:HU family DNA-binding protein n=1 Tax=Xylanibacter ruminicola TaxID=839 RepID=UPI0008E8025B|nr:HU family DNA-binding protein [Xylanibacter ruminicola]SFC08390.1 DNA-binding protein, histone-like, putative [Xylanibacter ruminicola]
MSVFYRLSKVTSPKAKGYGKWYPRAVITQTVDTEMLATIMQRNCTLKKADIVAVISELIETMADQLQDSKRVKLNGFGSFKIGIRGEGADSAADFSTSKNIKGLHVLFQPEVKTDGSGLRQKTFITGCSVQEAPKNDVDTTKPANSGSNGGSTSGNTQPSTGGNGGGSHEPIGD